MAWCQPPGDRQGLRFAQRRLLALPPAEACGRQGTLRPLQQGGQQGAAVADPGTLRQAGDEQDRTDHQREPMPCHRLLEHAVGDAVMPGLQPGGDLELDQLVTRQGLAAVISPQPAGIEHRQGRLALRLGLGLPLLPGSPGRP